MNKEEALKALAARRATPVARIDNSSLPAGAPMYYYCISCGQTADVLPESHFSAPRKLCAACRDLKDLGWLE